MRLIIDCDPGLDDALAIALALASPAFRLEAVVTVAGNADIDTVSHNAQAIIESLGADLPVYRGSDGALNGAMRFGLSMWGGTGTLGLPTTRSGILPPAQAGYRKALAAGPLTIAAIGPMTNVARLLEQEKLSGRNVEMIAIMGGAFSRSDSRIPSEFNFWADSRAAAAVLASGLPAVIAPIDVTRGVTVSAEDVGRLMGGSARCASLMAKLLPLLGKPGHPAAIHDACIIGWLLWPELFTSQRGVVTVETEIEDSLGMCRIVPKADGPHVALTGVESRMLIERIIAALHGSG